MTSHCAAHPGFLSVAFLVLLHTHPARDLNMQYFPQAELRNYYVLGDNCAWWTPYCVFLWVVLPNPPSNPVESWLSSSFSWWQALFRCPHSCLFPAMTLRPLVPRLGCAPETQNMKVGCGTGLPCWFKFFSSVDRIAQSFCREKHILDTHTHTPFHSNCPCRKCAVLCTSFLKTKLPGNSGGKKKRGGDVLEPVLWGIPFLWVWI